MKADEKKAAETAAFLFFICKGSDLFNFLDDTASAP
jgi:hypothetical protein